MKKTYNNLIGTGLLLIIGAAGGCDFGSATLSEAVLIITCGFAFFLSGLLLPGYITKRKRAKRALAKNTRKVSHTVKKYAPAENTAEARKNFVLITEI